MKDKEIIIITASEMNNLELARKFQTYFQKHSSKVAIINLLDLDLPLYSSRTEKKYKGEDLLSEQLPHLERARGFVFIAPEYNGSTPPVFNNFLAWLSRSSKDWRSFLNGKPAIIATFSGGGGFNVLLAMRTQLAFVGMNVLGRQILTHPSKPLDEKTMETVADELLRYSH